MYEFSTTFPRSHIPIAGIVICLSVLIGVSWGQGSIEPLIALAAASVFALFAWDIRVAVPVLILVLPFGPKFAMPFGNLYLATALLITCFVAWAWRNPLLPKPFSFHVNSIVVALAALMAVLFVSSLQNLGFLLSNQVNLLRFVQFFLYTSLFALVMQMSFSMRRIKTLLVLVMIAGAAEGLLGVWQWQTNAGVYVTGTFDYEHGNFAVYMVFIGVLFLGILLEARNAWLRAAYAAGVGISFYALVFSFARGGYVALAASVLTFFAMPLGGKRKIVLLALCGVTVLLVYLLMPVAVMYRASDIVSTLTGRQVALSFTYRLMMWRDALDDFLHNPILGKGAWSYNLRDNFYMKILGEAGILGFLAFMAVVYTILKEEWRAIRMRIKDDFIRGMVVGLLPATVGCLIVFDLSGDFFTVHRFMGTFWIVLALILLYCSGNRASGNSDA